MINQNNMDRKILRQIKDLQVQAEHLIKVKPIPTLEEISAYSKYNEETRSYLLTHLDEEMILEHVKQIPSIEKVWNESVVSKKAARSMLESYVSLFVGGSGERRKIAQGLETIRSIRDKYSSIEFLLKNYLD